jgi:hypothetical protein
VVGVGFCLAIMLLHNYCEPYIDPNLQRVKTISHWQICGLFFVALLLKADFESIQRAALGMILILILFYGLAHDMLSGLFLWHRSLSRCTPSEVHRLSCENPAPRNRLSLLLLRPTEEGLRPTQGGSIDLVVCDRPELLDGGERGISSPLYDDERMHK